MDAGQPRKKRKKIVKALVKLSRAQALLVQVALFALSEPDSATTNHHDPTAEVREALSSRPRRSVIPEWRTYIGFRLDMQHREREYLRHNDPPVSKKALALHVGKGDTEKSINRRMQDYGLDPEQHWPPSSWPDEEPSGQP